MNLTSIADVRSLLDGLGVHPNRTLGQNFLIDHNILHILVDAAGLQGGDGVLEIGPGLGVVTEELLRRAGRVVAVEKDAALAAHLKRRLAGEERCQILHADALDLNLNQLLASGLSRVVSNLPYSSGTRILVELIRAPARPERMVVTVQQEVGERLAAAPGGRDFSALSLWVQLDYEVELVRTIRSGCFWPRPDVESVIARLVRRGQSLAPAEDRQYLYDFSRQVFMHRRKQLTRILTALPPAYKLARETAVGLLEGLGIDPTARPETLAVPQWPALASAIRRAKLAEGA